MPRELTDRVIIITGASSGIGAATAVACAEAGMDVVLAARRREKLDEVARQVESAGRSALVVPCDVQRDEDVAELFRLADERFGRVDAVFANAGYGLLAAVAETTDEQMRAIFETNFHGTMRCIREALPRMRRQGQGHLLICSSAASEIPLPMMGAYSATKAAQDSIGGAMRAELAGTGIHVTTVHPVVTETGFSEAMMQRSPESEATRHKRSPLFSQSPRKVGRKIVRCLKRPRPEVWPNPAARLSLAGTTAVPRLADWALRKFVMPRYLAPADGRDAQESRHD